MRVGDRFVHRMTGQLVELLVFDPGQVPAWGGRGDVRYRYLTGQDVVLFAVET